MTAPAPLHPNTLAAHLRRKGFEAAKLRLHDGRPFLVPGFAIRQRPDGLHLSAANDVSRGGCGSLLFKMIAALAPDFEVAEDLGSRVVVRRKGVES